MRSALIDTTADSATTADGALEPDEIFHVLQNDRRRNVLRYLQGRSGPVPMREIAEQVAAWEHDTTVEQLSSDQRQRVYIPLYQSHLPKLDEVGAVTYQQNRGIVEREDAARVFDPYLDVIASPTTSTRSGELPDEDYYMAITALGVVLLLGAVTGMPVFSVISGIAITLMLLVLLVIPSVVRLFEPTRWGSVTA